MFKKLKKGRDKEGEWGKSDDRVMQAVEAGDIERLQLALAKKGTSPIKMGPDGRVPLHLAAKMGQFGCLDTMIQMGTIVSAADSQGCTVLHYAAMGGHTDCVQRIVQANAPPNARELTGKTALHLAVLGNHPDCVKILLKLMKTSIEATDESGRTPLIMATELGNLAICKDLIDKGANVNIQDHLNRTALMIACENNHKDVVDLLIKRGARTDLTDAQGYDAAYYATVGDGGEELKASLDMAPSVATWDIKSSDEINDHEPRADSIDLVDNFDTARCESPVPAQSYKQNGSIHQATISSQKLEEVTLTANAKSTQHSKEVKELEEENEILNDELSRLTLEHKRAVEKLKVLDEQKSDMGHGDNIRNQEFEEEFENIKRTLQFEKDKRTRAELEIETLKSRLVSAGGDVTEDDNDLDSNWGDSDDDLFELPGIDEPTGKVKPTKRIDITSKQNGENTGLVAILRSQIASLRQENEELKKSLLNTDANHVSQLEEEVSSLRQELDTILGRDVVSKDEYNELKAANRLEMAEMKNNNGILMDEIANISQRLAVSTDEIDTLRRKSASDGGQRSSNTSSANSTVQKQNDELLQQKQHLEETVMKHKQMLTEQTTAHEQLKGEYANVSGENERLRGQEKTKTQNGVKEYQALAAENVRLENLVAKQSKAIGQQSERTRCDKQRYTELAAERDRLVSEVQAGKVPNSAGVEKEKHIEESHHHAPDSAHTPDKVLCKKLTDENWKLQDEIRKQDDEVIRLRRELRKLSQGGNDDGASAGSDVRELTVENQTPRDRLHRDDSQRRQDAVRYDDLLVENERLRRVVQEQAEIFEGQLPTSVGFSKKRYAELLAENRKLKVQVQTEASSSEVELSARMGTNDQRELESMKVDVEHLQQQLHDADAKYTRTVTVYRAHLMSAVQGNLDSRVKDSLLKIVKLYKGEEFV